MRTARALVFLMVGIVGLGAFAAPASADRSHRHHRPHGGVVVRPSVSLSWGPAWGYWSPWWYAAPAWGGYPVVYPNNNYGGYGALDTDVSPERAEIWVDGRKVGLADDFDGFPTYLWLPKGTYDVVIYLPGYQTIARQYTIYPGLVIDVEDRMQKGQETHPLELGPKTHERRDARIRAEEERRRQLEESRRAEPEGWQEPVPDEPGARSDRALDARAEPGRLVLRLEPPDASVYLDGRFLGTGDELARLRSGLLVDPGSHRIEVVRPGWQSEEETVEIESGGEVTLEIELDEDD